MKVIILLKRRPDISHEEFRHHYETVHSELAHKYVGHLLVEYRRNYPQLIEGSDQETDAPDMLHSPYDAITELRYPDRAAYEESRRIMSDPVIGKIFEEDEENFMDRAAFRIFTCEEVTSPEASLRR